MERYAVIMAGGAGLRLWPLSRQSKPKQFLNAGSDKCMLVQTIERIIEIIPADRCYVITNQCYESLTKDVVNGLVPLSNVILEPMSQNTAACITHAVLLMKKKHENGIVCCIPADGYVGNRNAYNSALKTACKAAELNKELVVIGIKPTYPETGYGYIKADMDKRQTNNKVFPVIQFLEKPDVHKAKEFVASGEYLWNSGILIGSMDVVLNKIKCYLPTLFEKLSEAVDSKDKKNSTSALKQAYREIQPISIDQGVLEKCKDILIVYGNFDWNDIGNLDALSKTMDTDSKGNAIKGSHIGIDTNNCVIYGSENLIATIGLENMIIVNMGDVLLICPREKAQEIKSLTEVLQHSGYKEYL